MIYKYKRGQFFVSLIAIFIFVSFISIYLLVITPNENVFEEISFGKGLVLVSNFNKIENSFKISSDLLVDLEKKNFPNLLGIANLNGPSKMCYDSKTNKFFLYDEKPKEEYDSNGNLKEVIVDCTSSFTDSKNKNVFLILENNFNSISSLLFPYKNLGVASSYDLIDGKNLFFINFSYSNSNEGYTLNYNDSLKYELSTSSFSSKFNVISSRISSLSSNFKKLLTNCLNVEPFGVEECSSKIVKNKVFYDLESSKVSSSVVGDFIEVKLEFFLDSIDSKFVRYLRFKNTNPFNLISFNVAKFSNVDNSISLEVFNPTGQNSKTNKKVEGYVVLYSNYNFFDKGSEGYSQLISDLSSEKKIPNEFSESLHPYDFRKDVSMRHSKEDKKYKLSLLYVPATGDKEIIPIFEYYDFNSGSYQRFSEGDLVYVYVFAVDSSYVYYVDESSFSNNIKSITLSRVEPYPPVRDSQVKLLSVLDDSFSFEISRDSSLSDFGSFDFYLCDRQINNFNIFERVPSFSSNCDIFKNMPEGKYLVGNVNDPSYNVLSPVNVDLSNSNLRFYILQNSISGNSLKKPFQKRYSFIETSVNDQSYYHVKKNSAFKSIKPFELRLGRNR